MEKQHTKHHASHQLARCCVQAESGQHRPGPATEAQQCSRNAASALGLEAVSRPAACLIMRLTATCSSALASSLSASAQRHCSAQVRRAPSSPLPSVQRLRWGGHLWGWVVRPDGTTCCRGCCVLAPPLNCTAVRILVDCMCTCQQCRAALPSWKRTKAVCRQEGPQKGRGHGGPEALQAW